MNTYTIDTVYIGLKCSFTVEITQSHLDCFLQITGDNNPLHTNVTYAKANGFDNIVVYGMLTSAFYSTLVGVHLPGKYAILQGVDVQFTKPVFVGDKLTITGEVSYINEIFKQIEIKAAIINQDTKRISKALIKVGLLQ